MTIRRATPADAQLLTELGATTAREAFGPPHNPADVVDDYIRTDFAIDTVRSELNDPAATFLVMEDEAGKAVGYAKLRRRTPPRQITARPAIEIQRIYLLRESIGQGQGRRLMEHCLDLARANQYAVAYLGVWEHNLSAIAFYTRLGFVRVGWHYFQFGADRQRDFWFQKQL